MPVLPLWAAAGGAGAGAAGGVTGVFMAATVAAQLGVPALLRTVGHRACLALGAAALGAPAVLLPLSPSLGLLLPVAVVRGVGFGVLTVTGAALVSDLVPARLRGRATGLYGVAIGVPQLVLLTGGVWAWDRLGPTAVLLVGAALPLIALPAMLLLPRRVVPPDPVTPDDPAGPADHAAPPDGRALLRASAAPWSVMLVCAASAGGVITVLPLASSPVAPVTSPVAALAPVTSPVAALAPVTSPVAALAPVALLVLTAAQILGRSASGELGDRVGRAGLITAPALGVVAAGAGVVALGLVGGTGAGVVVGSGLVGLGFGAVQNDTLVTLFARAGPGRSGAASTVWNTAYDSGTGLGATALAAVLGAAGAPASFAVAAAAGVVVTPVAVASAVRAGVTRRAPGRPGG